MKLLTFRELKLTRGISYTRDHVRRLEKSGRFPLHVELGSGGRIAWIESEVEEWLANRIAARDAKGRLAKRQTRTQEGSGFSPSAGRTPKS